MNGEFLKIAKQKNTGVILFVFGMLLLFIGVCFTSAAGPVAHGELATASVLVGLATIVIGILMAFMGY